MPVSMPSKSEAGPCCLGFLATEQIKAPCEVRLSLGIHLQEHPDSYLAILLPGRLGRTPFCRVASSIGRTWVHALITRHLVLLAVLWYW